MNAHAHQSYLLGDAVWTCADLPSWSLPPCNSSRENNRQRQGSLHCSSLLNIGLSWLGYLWCDLIKKIGLNVDSILGCLWHVLYYSMGQKDNINEICILTASFSPIITCRLNQPEERKLQYLVCIKVYEFLSLAVMSLYGSYPFLCLLNSEVSCEKNQLVSAQHWKI